MSGYLITLHFDLCAGYMSGVHFVRIQVVYLMICVIVYILYIDKNDKLKNHSLYRQKVAYTHCCLLAESHPHTVGQRLFKKNKPIS